MSRNPILVQLMVIRVNSGLSQRAVGRALGMHGSTVYQWEVDGRNITLNSAMSYADVLGYELVLLPKEPKESNEGD